MSAKDIAQFTNLTIRGVETARYRIRKKLAIPGNINLVDFLIDFTEEHLLNIPSNFTPLFCWDFLKKFYLCNVNN